MGRRYNPNRRANGLGVGGADLGDDNVTQEAFEKQMLEQACGRSWIARDGTGARVKADGFGLQHSFHMHIQITMISLANNDFHC